MPETNGLPEAVPAWVLAMVCGQLAGLLDRQPPDPTDVLHVRFISANPNTDTLQIEAAIAGHGTFRLGIQVQAMIRDTTATEPPADLKRDHPPTFPGYSLCQARTATGERCGGSHWTRDHDAAMATAP